MKLHFRRRNDYRVACFTVLARYLHKNDTGPMIIFLFMWIMLRSAVCQFIGVYSV